MTSRSTAAGVRMCLKWVGICIQCQSENFTAIFALRYNGRGCSIYGQVYIMN